MKPLAEITASLESTLLRAVLTQTPLPDTDSVICFPDMRYILEAEETVISEENLTSSPASDLNVVILASEEIEERSQGKEPFPYMRFQAPKFHEDRLIITLEVRLAFGNLEALGLGAIIAEFFEQADGTWKAVEMPTVLAY